MKVNTRSRAACRPCADRVLSQAGLGARKIGSSTASFDEALKENATSFEEEKGMHRAKSQPALGE